MTENSLLTPWIDRCLESCNARTLSGMLCVELAAASADSAGDGSSSDTSGRGRNSAIAELG